MSKKDKLIEKYSSSIIAVPTLRKLIDGDTTPTKKYAEKIIQYYLSRLSLGIRRQSEIFKDIAKFDELLPYINNKDIYNTEHYPNNNYELFKDVIRDAEVIKEEKTFVREEHATILYEDENTLLVRPLTHRGSLKYGANTRWCTVSKDNPNTFKSYFDSNYLFYLIRKNKQGTKWDKIALQFPKQQNIFGGVTIYDANDSRANEQSFSKCDWNLTDIIKFETICKVFCNRQKELDNAHKTISQFKSSVLEYDYNKLNKAFELLQIKTEDNFYEDLKNQIKLLADRLKLEKY